MKRSVWQCIGLVAVAVLLTAGSAAAQNPCVDVSATQVQVSPTKYYAQLPEQTVLEIDGSPRVTDYQVAYFATGANPLTATPVAGPVVMAKTAWTLVAGTTDCYTAAMPIPAPTGNVAVVGALKARRAGTATISAAESPWSVISNPFGSAPAVLATPGLKVARQ
jgi:hypothetical protein